MNFSSRGPFPLDIYTDLAPITNQRVKLNSDTPFVPHYVKSNLSRSADPVQLYASRVRGRQILLENPVRESKIKKEREERKARQAAANKRSDAGVIATSTARRKGLVKVPAEERRFDLFVNLHDMWMGHMSELLALPPASSGSTQHAQTQAASMHAKLIKADFNGAMITVKQCKNPALVGISGIVILETQETFKIVTQADQLKVLPKRNSVFAFSVPLYATTASSTAPASNSSPSASTPNVEGPDGGMTSPAGRRRTVLDLPRIELELYGNQFCFRPADRASRKFKHKETIEL